MHNVVTGWLDNAQPWKMIRLKFDCYIRFKKKIVLLSIGKRWGTEYKLNLDPMDPI